MSYDFTTLYDRTGKDAMAVEVIPVPGVTVKEGFSKIPMWVADMNFATAPTIPQRIAERLSHPLYGYFDPRDEYYDAIANWQKSRNGVEGLSKEQIGYENGVLGCVASAIQAFTSPGDEILLHAPTYIGFTGTIARNGRNIVTSDLKKDADGVWRMDYEDMEEKLRTHRIRFAIFCSPHNPTGRVWEREEIERAMALYKAYDCVVLSDEIWSDLILPGYRHIPTQSVSEDAKKRTIAVYAPSKTFNLAGLIGSYHVVYDAYLHDRLIRQSSLGHYNSMNLLSMYALLGAYCPVGAAWLEELKLVLEENVDYACDFIETHMDGVSVSRPQGTYMLYLDCSDWCKTHGKDVSELLKAGIEIGVIWQDGEQFLMPHTIRMNLALPTAKVVEAFDRLVTYVF